MELGDFLQKNNIRHTFMEHDDTSTSRIAAAAAGISLHDIVKSILFKTDNGFVLVLIRADCNVDWKKLGKLTNSKKARLATPDEVLDVTGYPVGAVPPIGLKDKVKTFIDKGVTMNEAWAGGGATNRLVRLSVADIREYSRAETVEVSS